MSSTSSFKQEFLKKWIKGLQFCNNSKKQMSFLERKNAIKLSADVAMASARNGSTYWSRALIANASKSYDNKSLVDEMLGNNSGKLKNASIASFSGYKMVCKTKKPMKRSKRVCRVNKKKSSIPVKSSIIAKRLVKKRTNVLKKLVPGGEFIEEFSLLEEILDYTMSLKAQVDVMKCLANATEQLNGK